MSNTHPSRITLPAEWAPQSAIQLTWPHAATDWKPYLQAITATFVELAREIARRQKLVIVSPEAEKVRELLLKELGEALLRNVRFCTCATNDTWARDHGAITLCAADAAADGRRECRLLDFKFNAWGEKFAWRADNDINRQLLASGLLHGTMENHNDFVLEGGSIESDGQGTIMTTTSCLLAPHRNQPLTQPDIERRLKRVLHAEQVVWLEHGTLIGDDTDGHIDTIVRMAPDDTLLYVGCDDPADEHHADFAALEMQLQRLRTMAGRPYRLLRLPMPRAMYDGGERLPATYANFVILNGAVIVPTYRQPDNDRRAMEIIGDAFPDRELIGMDASTVVRQHGSLHCLTMQYPAGVVD